MFDLFNSKDEQDFSDPESITDDFILLAYGDTSNKLKQDFVGTTKNRRILRILTYSNEEKYLKSEDLHTFENEIVHIIPCDFNDTGNLGYVISFRDTAQPDLFNVVFYDSQIKKIVDLGASDRIPFLYSHDAWKNTILLQNKEYSEIVFYDGENIKKIEKDFPRLAQNHSSAFIDVDGDLKADLVFVSCDENGNRLIIIQRSQENGEFSEIQRINIHKNSGPLVFADFDRTGSVDIAYVSIEGNDYYLNILLNTRHKPITDIKNKKELYDDNTPTMGDIYKLDSTEFCKKIHLNSMFPGLKPRIETIKELNGDVLATGIFVSDIDFDTFPDLILIFDGINDINKTAVKILQNKFIENKVFEPFKHQLKDFQGILSVSVCDYMKTGRESLILNKIDNADFKLLYIENNMSKGSYRLTALTVSPNQDKRKYGSYVPGVTYKYYIEEKKIMRIGNQLPQSSFLHLQMPSVFFGLGSLNYMIDSLYISGPRSSIFGSIYSVKNKILPNSDLVLRPNSKGIGVELFLRLGRHAKNIVGVFLLVLIFNLLFVLYSYRQERKKLIKEKKKESYLFNFDAI